MVGKVFWAGALAEMGDRDPREVEQALHELSRKELVRPSRTSSMEGEAEYGFWHLLVRDVCYAQIPRAARAARHRSRRGLARATRPASGSRTWPTCSPTTTCRRSSSSAPPAQTEEAEELEAAAIRYLALAGERALALDVERAEASLARALALAPPATRSARRCSSAGRRRRSSRAGSRRHEPRSRRRSISTGRTGTTSPPGGC